MERSVKVHTQRFKAMGDGRFKVKVQERELNLASLMHHGENYLTVKELGRGRYIMKKDPKSPPPAKLAREEKALEAGPLAFDEVANMPARAPMTYNPEVG